jgi:hypothetical protein
MSQRDLNAGRRWVEQRFAEIARDFGAPRALAQEDRWREIDPLRKHDHSMTYYIELRGHLTRGELTFGDVDLEIAGTGEPAAREKLGRQIRDRLALSASERE